MKLKEALVCDTRKEGSWEGINALLFKIPPLKKYESEGEVPLEALEKMLWVFAQKYNAQFQYMMPVIKKLEDKESINYYSCSFKTRDHQWIGTVHGVTLHECFAKGVLMCYGHIKRNEKNES